MWPLYPHLSYLIVSMLLQYLLCFLKDKFLQNLVSLHCIGQGCDWVFDFISCDHYAYVTLVCQNRARSVRWWKDHVIAVAKCTILLGEKQDSYIIYLLIITSFLQANLKKYFINCKLGLPYNACPLILVMVRHPQFSNRSTCDSHGSAIMMGRREKSHPGHD